MQTQSIVINLVPNLSTPAVVRVSQNDVGRPLKFIIMDGIVPADLTGVTATVEGTKKSGLGFSESGTVTDNTVTLNTTLAMTQEDGSIPAEIRFSKTGEDVGTANFILAVEKSPHLDGTTDGTTETMAGLETRLQGQIDALDSRIDAIEGDQSIIDDIDALDARVTALEHGGGGLTEAVKSAMLQVAQKVAYIDEHGQTYYDALYNALYPPAELVSITAVYTQSGTVYTTASLDDLKSDLTVSAEWSDGTSSIVADTDYTLSGTLTEGTSTITVNYGGQSTTFDVTVTAPPTLQSITATYTQSGPVYDTDTLDSLKSDLVVTANYSDSTSETVTDYTLSGTLTEGTSTVTVSYGGKTATFNVVVEHNDYNLTWDYADGLPSEHGFTKSSSGGTPIESMTEDGYLIKGKYGVQTYYKLDNYMPNVMSSGHGVLEATFSIPTGEWTGRQFFAVLNLSDGTNGIGVVFLMNVSQKSARLCDGSNWQSGTELLNSWSYDTDYTVKMEFSNGIGSVYIDGTLVKDNIDITSYTNSPAISFGIGGAGGNGTEGGACFKSFKLGYTA